MIFRDAVPADLPAILALMADDILGASREIPCGPQHKKALADITADPRNRMIVVEREGELIGCAQLTYIPGLSRNASERALIESVRIRSDLRGQGLGQQLFEWLIAEATAHGCTLVQLTTDKRRTDAHRFYDRLGFTKSHEGYKLTVG
ncbi:GNAT family N-acetyltransferase [Longispora albida]|uniref:GNAT family N-acetyltransferase n=1 Tax=Longispora albida TaxID=203523 RepID=UPI00037019FE|nr:GNAT family N-acetyltransferase [Longispora albida]